MDNTKLIRRSRVMAAQYADEHMQGTAETITHLCSALEAAEAELTRRDTIQALHDEGDRVVLSSAIGAVVWNASNHPKPSAVLGRDISPLREKLVDAVIAAGFTRAAPVSLEAVKAETTTEWQVFSRVAKDWCRASSEESARGMFRDAPGIITGIRSRQVTEWRPVSTEGDNRG